MSVYLYIRPSVCLLLPCYSLTVFLSLTLSLSYIPSAASSGLYPKPSSFIFPFFVSFYFTHLSLILIRSLTPFPFVLLRLSPPLLSFSFCFSLALSISLFSLKRSWGWPWMCNAYKEVDNWPLACFLTCVPKSVFLRASVSAMGKKKRWTKTLAHFFQEDILENKQRDPGLTRFILSASLIQSFPFWGKKKLWPCTDLPSYLFFFHLRHNYSKNGLVFPCCFFSNLTTILWK